jgi:hypothetical protein
MPFPQSTSGPSQSRSLLISRVSIRYAQLLGTDEGESDGAATASRASRISGAAATLRRSSCARSSSRRSARRSSNPSIRRGFVAVVANAVRQRHAETAETDGAACAGGAGGAGGAGDSGAFDDGGIGDVGSSDSVTLSVASGVDVASAVDVASVCDK